MALDPLTLVLTNVGLSVFKNWRNNKQSRKLQEKQQEYARASAKRNKQRMWQLMREGQELALEMERESHENRVEDIKSDFDNILHRLTYSAAIKMWPLKVLPIVMKNQSLGNLLATTDENIALHCIFTPSNCPKFNAQVFPAIEECLADFCNLHWSTLSSHLILFYSGAWQSGTAPTGVEIDQLKTNLRSLPTLIVTPFFKGTEGNMVFQLHAWGIGQELETEIECTNFSNPYVKGTDYTADADLKSTTIEEFVPYLQCLIGYIADQYFWTNHNESPLLPTLMAMNVVNTDGMRYLHAISEERYNHLLEVCEVESESMPFVPEKMLALFEGCAALWDEETRKRKLEEVFMSYAQRNAGTGISSMKEALCCEHFSKYDLPFLREFMSLYSYNDYKQEFADLKEVLDTVDFDYSILDSKDIVSLEKLAEKGNPEAMYRLGELYEYAMRTNENILKAKKYYESSANKGFLFAKIKVGDMDYSDLSDYNVESFRLMNVIQIDALYSEYLLQQENLSMSKLDEAIAYFSKRLMSSSNPYAHTGLIYNVAALMLKQDVKSCTARNMLQVASKLGYTKSLNLYL